MLKKIRLEKLRRKMKKDFKTFFKATEPERYGNAYLYGKHTIGLIDICQKAYNKLEQGTSSYIIVNIPYRHGKSDVISRRFPVWALINNPRLQIMEGCATADLAKEMSYDARKCFEKICSLYETKNEKDFNTATSWRTINGGGMFGSGLGGTVVGKGADICIVDDYYRNRADADSELIRNKVREGFTNDFLTRLAPVHIVLIVSTRWHEADLCGWIIDKNDKASDNYDSSFPIFEHVKYKAQNEDGSFLFPERFSPEYYNYQKSTLGEYGWNALAQQDPRPRQGNILKAERVKIVDNIEMKKEMYWHLGCDLAHTNEGKGDPDYTVLTMACLFEGKIYVKNVWRFRESALKRDETIKKIVGQCPPGIDLRIEKIGGAKDSFLYLKRRFSSFVSVKPYHNKLGKLGHAGILEPVFESFNVIIEKGNWNTAWINELKAVPGGKHDDQMDSLFIAINIELLKNKNAFFIDKKKVNAHTEDEAVKDYEDVYNDWLDFDDDF